MNGKELFIALGDISAKYYEEAESTPPLSHPRRFKKPLLIAALIALTLLLVGCTALIWNLRQMRIAEIHNEEMTYVDLQGNIVTTPEYSYEIFSLHGLEGTPTYQAHQEWFAFLETYDQDHTLMLAADDKPMDVPEAYEAYNPYTQEMVDKIDEITEKYGLKLLGAFAPFQSWETEIFRKSTGIDTLLVENCSAQIELGSGYFYEGGNFSLTFDMTMPRENGAWPYPMLNSAYYSKADYFDEVYWAIGDTTRWEQWNYTTKSGHDLLILSYKDGGGARLFHKRDDAIITYSIEGQYCADYNDVTNEPEIVINMTKDQLKQIADQLDFSLRVDTVDIAYAKENLERFIHLRKLEAEKDPEGFTSYLQPSYSAFIETHLAGKGSPRYKAEQFALYDINGDGTEELLLGNNDKIYEIVYTVNGNAEMVHDGADGSNHDYYPEFYQICHDGYLVSLLDGGDFTYFTAYTTEEFEGKIIEKAVETLRFVPKGEAPWSRKNPQTGHYDPISEEEYQAIVDTFPPIDIRMYPISQFRSE